MMDTAITIALPPMQPGTVVPMHVPVINQTVDYFFPAFLGSSVDASHDGGMSKRTDCAPWMHWACARFALASFASQITADDLVSPRPEVQSSGIVATQLLDLPDKLKARLDRSLLEEVRRAIGLHRHSLRDGFSWVGGPTPKDAWLVPPPTSAITPLLDDLFEFLNTDSIDPSVRIALGAYQMIHVHPYVSGNGRTTRTWVWASGIAAKATDVTAPTALLLSLRKSQIGDAMKALRQGRSQPLQQLLERSASAWLATSRVVEDAVQALLVAPLQQSPLGRRAEQLARLHLLAGRLGLAQLTKVTGQNEQLANKYLRTIVSMKGWHSGTDGAGSLPELDAEVTQAVRRWTAAME